MDWFDDLVDKAGDAWDDVKETGSEYVSGMWEEKKEGFLSSGETKKETVAAIPNAQPKSEAGTGSVTKKSGINWQAAGVVVGALGLLSRLL